MSLVGNLEDLGLGEILQIVSLSRKSGVLSIHSAGREASIVFRQGQVVKASSTGYPVSLGEALLAKGVVDQTTLEFARSLQQDGGYSQRLGDILVQECQVDAGALEDAVREVVENVVYSLFAWDEGTFDFELQDNLETVEDIRVDPLQYTLGQGLNAQFLAMEGSRIIDEQRYGEAREPVCAVDGGAEEGVDFAFDLMQEPPSEAVPPITAPQPPPVRQLVLVDDDQVAREVLAGILVEQGYAVASFGRGEDALIGIDTLQRSGARPALVVDLIMPRMDGTGVLGGLELLELVNSNFPELAALVLTDHYNAEAERRLSQLGYPLMPKPVSGELADSAVCLAFGERLGRQLARVEAGERIGPGGTVNIGDELRLEMGEELTATLPMPQSTGISLLRGMLEELNNPALGGGIILLVLRFASEFMSRAVIFIVKEDEIAGLGQFGIEERELAADVRVRDMRIPLKEKTVFSQVVESQLPAKLQLDNSPWSLYLLEQLGGNPAESFLGPIISEGKVVALLYGDNGDDGRPIGDTDSLEIFLSQAGIAMEKVLLQRRLREKHPEGV